MSKAQKEQPKKETEKVQDQAELEAELKEVRSQITEQSKQFALGTHEKLSDDEKAAASERLTELTAQRDALDARIAAAPKKV